MARMEPWRNSDEASALNDADKAVEMVRQIGDGAAVIIGALGVLLPIVSALFAGRSASPAAQICKAARLPDVTVVPTTPKGPTKSRRRGSRAAFVAERERQRPDRRPLQTSRLSKAGPARGSAPTPIDQDCFGFLPGNRSGFQRPCRRKRSRNARLRLVC